MPAEPVRIHYRRLPDDLVVFEQALVHEEPGVVVTLLDAAPVRRPVTAGGRVVLEPGAPVVWFTYPGLWHDIGRFHLADGTFTGYYANVLTPVVMDGRRWETTDLFLDLWLGADGALEILDRDEMDEALASGALDAELAERAVAEAEGLRSAAEGGSWPPEHTRWWTLERARAALAEPRSENR